MAMPPFLWLRTLSNVVLGTEPQLRRHVLFVLATAQLYAVSMAVATQSFYMGVIAGHMATLINLSCLAVFSVVYTLVRSGRTARWSDPVVAFPHAVACLALCVMAYVLLGSDRGNLMILIAQTIVASMLRLQPRQVLTLGCMGVLMLASAVLYVRHTEAATFGEAIGWLHLTVGGSTILLLSLVAKWVSDIRVRLGRQAHELKDALDTLQQMATTDMLTGLVNRRVMAELLDDELKLAAREGRPLCVAMIDIDHFKLVNDHFGHHAGDSALKTLAQHANAQIRQVDRLSRWGGEEFLMLLPRVAGAEALVAMERLRESTQSLRFPNHEMLQLSISLGIAQVMEGDTAERLVERADQALYEAKRSGRNRCVLASMGPNAEPPATAQAASSALAMDLSVGKAFLGGTS